MILFGLKTALFKHAFYFETFTRLFLRHFLFESSLFVKDCGFEATRSKTFLEKFWFRIKTCVRWHFGFGATLFRKHSFRSKPFWIPSKVYFEERMLAKHFQAKLKQDFSRALLVSIQDLWWCYFGFGARLSGKLCFRIKTFLERFWSKSKTFCSRN